MKKGPDTKDKPTSSESTARKYKLGRSISYRAKIDLDEAAVIGLEARAKTDDRRECMACLSTLVKIAIDAVVAELGDRGRALQVERLRAQLAQLEKSAPPLAIISSNVSA